MNQKYREPSVSLCRSIFLAHKKALNLTPTIAIIDFQQHHVLELLPVVMDKSLTKVGEEEEKKVENRLTLQNRSYRRLLTLG